jgi:hypothetical protein
MHAGDVGMQQSMGTQGVIREVCVCVLYVREWIKGLRIV